MNESLSASNKQTFTRRLKEARIGDPAAQYDVALMYANGVGVGKDIAQAFAWTKASAEKGHTVAQYLLGSAYSSGLGTPKDLGRCATGGRTRRAMRSQLIGCPTAAGTDLIRRLSFHA